MFRISLWSQVACFIGIKSHCHFQISNVIPATLLLQTCGEAIVQVSTRCTHTHIQLIWLETSLFKIDSLSTFRIWKENSIAKKFSPQAAELYRSAFTLRQRMMNAVQNLEYYMMIEVIEPNWHIFIQNMSKVCIPLYYTRVICKLGVSKE